MPLLRTGAISGDTPTSVSLQSLLRSDTGAAPAGLITLPANYVVDPTIATGWAFAYLDPSPALMYQVIFRLHWSDGTFNDIEYEFTPAPLEIDLTVTGATVVTLTTIVPLPTGVTLPATMIGGQGGVWSLPFVDATEPAPGSYVYAFTSNGAPAVGTGSLLVSGTTPPNGGGQYKLTSSGGMGAESAPMTSNGTTIGTDGLQLLGVGGNPIAGATINVWAAADVAFSALIATQTTTADGRWANGVNLNSGAFVLTMVGEGYEETVVQVVVP